MKNYINTLSGINTLGKLCCDLSEQIYQNRNRVDKLLKQNKELQGLGSLIKDKKVSPLYSFDETDEMYNSQISFAEKQAWVWYKQSIGIPMYGWGKYFLKVLKKDETISDLVYCKKDGILMDNHFRQISKIIKGQLIGKYLKNVENGEFGEHYICRNSEGIVIVSANNAEIKKSSKENKVDEKQLYKLVKEKALLYLDGEFLPYPIYAYANIYERQKQLQADKDFIIKNFGEDVYNFQYEICHYSQSKEHAYGALPEKKSIINENEIDRPFISPISSFASDQDEFFIKLVRDEFMNIENSDETTMVNGEIKQQKKDKRINIRFDGDTKYSLQTVFMKWLFTLQENDFNEVNAAQIVDYYLRNKAYRDDKLEKEEKAVLKAQTRNEGDILFQRFLHEVLTYEDQVRLDFIWNMKYNGHSKLKYDKIPIAFEISRMFKTGILKLTEMQREAIGFLEISGNGIVSLDVGGGKTMILIISLAIGLQQGKFKRPLLVLPKPVYSQFIKEMEGYTDKKTDTFVPGVLSGTNINFNEWFNLGSDNSEKLKDEFYKEIKENTITVVTKEAIKKMGFTNKEIDRIMPDLVEIFDNNETNERGEAKSINKILEMIGGAQKGSILDIDILGFDAIYADEAHAYKNIFSGVKPDKYDKVKRYDLTGPTSDFGIRFFFLAHYIQRKFGRNVVLATATPFQKAVLEIYSMLSLVSFNELKRNEIINIKRFCDLFIRREMDYVATLTDTLELKEVIKSFVNADILRSMINSVIYYRSKENFTNVILPCKINLPLINKKEGNHIVRLKPSEQIVTYLKMSKLQAENQKQIINDMGEAYLLNKKEKKAAIFRGLANALKNCFSPYDYSDSDYENYKDFVENSSKIYACCLAIKSVKEFSEKNKMNMPGQIIYANRGKKYFIDIKEYLDKEVGFKTDIKFERTKIDEVEIITSETVANRKEIIKEAFNKGICKIIIGTSTIQEGLNLQQYATDIHVINTEWNPTAMVQLAGRIHRQGNPFGYVRFTVYLLQDSIDVFMFQKNEEKIARINELMEQNGQKVIDGDTIDANEIKYSLITDIDLIVKMDYDKERNEHDKEIKKLQNNLELIQTVKTDIEYYQQYKNEVINRLENFKHEWQVEDFFDVSGQEFAYKNKKITKAELDIYKNRNERALKIKDLIEKINEIDDKEILNLCRLVISYQKSYDFNVGIYRNCAGYDSRSGVAFYSSFAELVSKIIKAEKTILRPKGYDRNSDFTNVIADLNKDIKQKIDSYLSLYGQPSDHEKNDNYYKETMAYKFIFAKVKEMKNSLDISGKEPQQVAEDFAKLNHILKYTIDNRPCGNECCIPEADGKARVVNNKGFYYKNVYVIPLRKFSENDDYINRIGQAIKQTPSDFDFDEFYKVAKQNNAGNIDLFEIDGIEVIPAKAGFCKYYATSEERNKEFDKLKLLKLKAKAKIKLLNLLNI